MSDHLKSMAVLATLCTAGLTAALFAPASGAAVGPTIVVLRIAGALVLLSCIALTVWLFRRPDKAPDYLRQLFGSRRFDSNGVGFAFDVTQRDGRAILQTYFQNRCEKPAQLKLVLRQYSLGIHRDSISFMINCDGGAFGITSIPMAVPEKQQGKKRSYTVQADATFPGGKGKTLRHHGGRFVGSGEQKPGMALAALCVGGVVGAAMCTGRSVSIKLRMPTGVAGDPPAHPMPETENLWLPGDEDIDLNATTHEHRDVAVVNAATTHDVQPLPLPT